VPGVFISYRREDSAGYAGRLFDVLSSHFGRQNTFMDLDTIQGGDDFTSVIDQKIDVSDVLIAVIGAHWLTVKGQDGTRRLDNPQDFVRIEIARALERGIRVIPVLVGGAAVPAPEDLPEALRPLCERQALEIRDAHFHPDAQVLIELLQKALRASGGPSRKKLVSAVLGAAAVILLSSGILVWKNNRLVAGPQAKPAAPTASATQPGPVDAKPVKPPATPANVSGKWTANVKYDWGDTYDEIFEFEVDGSEVSGMAGLLGDREGHGRAIRDGKIQGNRLSFMTRTLTTTGSNDQYAEDKHYYKGTADGDTIHFTMITDSTVTEHSPIHFVAKRKK
jgi:hypothetical protein